MNESTYSRFYHFSHFLNRVTHQHVTCAEFAALPEGRLGYRIASFVRNPYDRVYSAFLQVRRDLLEHADAAFPADWIAELVRGQLEENRRQLERSGYDFNRWVASLKESQIYDVGRNTSFPLHPAHYWTHLGGSQYVTFIGRVERFERDLAQFCREVGIEAPERRNSNVSVAEGGAGALYRHIGAMNESSIDKINRLFANDFELFGYDRLVGGCDPARAETAGTGQQ